jgi:hypothetical protein
MRSLVPLLLGVALSLPACKAQQVTSVTPCNGCLTLMPPVPGLIAEIRVLSVAGRPPDLQVSASLVNRTFSRTTFVVLPCPLVIRLSPYPPGSYGAGAADECPSGRPQYVLAYGDSIMMTRVLDADTLASLTPGEYAVSVDVTYHEITRTDGNTIEGALAGLIRLPLDSTSQPLNPTSPWPRSPSR